MHNPVSNYRQDIDGLRAIAVIAVIINHFDKNLLPGGYLGVDMFFVISGFVITASLARRNNTSHLIDFLSAFYLRRIKRLSPALIVFVLVNGLLICLFNPDPGQSLKTGIAALLGGSNFYLITQSMDYFAESTELNVFTHTWSLGVEEQFYFLFPLLLWVTGFSRGGARGWVNIFSVVGILSISSLALFIYFYPISTFTAYFLMPTRFWELGAGCLLCIGLMPSGSFLHRVENIPSLLILAGIIGVFFLPIVFAVPATVAVVVLTVMLIAGMRTGTIAYKFFTHPKLVYIGLISYSLYLWHWGVLAISHWTVGIHWWTVPFQLALILLISMASYYYVEKPFRQCVWSNNHFKSIGYGFSALMVAIACLAALSSPLVHKAVYLGNEKDQAQEQFDRSPPECRFNDQIKLNIQACVRPRKQQKRFYLLGDSHAGMFTRVADNLLGKDFEIVSITGSSCIFPAAFAYTQMISEDCGVTQTDLGKWVLDDAKPGDIIFIGNALLNYFYYKRKAPTGYVTQDGEVIGRDMAYTHYIRKLQDFAELAASKGVRVGLYIDPAIFSSISVTQCIETWYKHIDMNVYRIDKKEILHARRLIVEIPGKAVANGAPFEVWDGMISEICDKDYCYPTGYADSHHLKPALAKKILAQIIKRHHIADSRQN